MAFGKERILNCFENFRCIADKCKHSCCVGWDVEIDKKSLKKYKRAKGEWGILLGKGIDFKNKKFILSSPESGKRCSFLREDNLCEIIINGGEKSLCRTCREHPRFRTFFRGITECGIGLCCEEGTRLLLSFDDRIRFSAARKGSVFCRPTAWEREILSRRGKFIDIVYDREKSIVGRIKRIFGECGISERRFFGADYLREFASLEPLDGEWNAMIRSARIEDVEFDGTFEGYAEKLLCYFIYRHAGSAADEFDFRSRISFSVLSLYIIYALYLATGSKGYCGVAEAARAYSAEIEYSEANMNRLLDLSDGTLIIK